MTKATKVTVRVKGSATVKVTVTTKSRDKRRLVFGLGNAKLGNQTVTFSLPSGWACPFAQDCLSRADRQTGTIGDGPHTQFRCFSASQESRYPSVRDARWRNFQALRGLSRQGTVDLIMACLPEGATAVRVHVAGDFFSQTYFDAWLEVARRLPEVTLYFYTKSLRYWAKRQPEVGDGHTPGAVPNFVPTASQGGKDDHLIDEHGLRSAVVVFSETEAAFRGLPIDHDDSHAMTHGSDFALLLHGSQPAGSEAAKAVAALRAQGEYGYGEKANEMRVRHGRLPLVTVG